MRLPVVLAVMVLVTGFATAQADDKAAIDAVNKAAVELDAAFERQNAETIETLLPPEHLAVTPYYGAPQSPADQIASLPELKFTQSVVGEVSTELLSPNAALRTFTAKVDGTFKGKPIPPALYVGELWVQRDGVWRQRFYQVTALTGATTP